MRTRNACGVAAEHSDGNGNGDEGADDNGDGRWQGLATARASIIELCNQTAKNKRNSVGMSERVGAALPHKHTNEKRKGKCSGPICLSSTRPDAGRFSIAGAIPTTSTLRNVRVGRAKRSKRKYERSERAESVLYTAWPC